MSEEVNPQQQKEQLDSYQEQVLNKYSELFEESVLEAANQALEDRLAHAEAIAINKAFSRFKEHSQSLLQERLQNLNRENSQKIIELRSNMGYVENPDNSPDLQKPSLQSGINKEKEQFGKIASKSDSESLPSDLSESLNY